MRDAIGGVSEQAAAAALSRPLIIQSVRTHSHPPTPAPRAGKAIWKLDDPDTLRSERDARTQLAAEAARKKLSNTLAAKQKDVEKYEKLAALPEPQVRAGLGGWGGRVDWVGLGWAGGRVGGDWVPGCGACRVKASGWMQGSS